ncbi:bifunctional 2-polyprenyl-6-hydroxyphenol methylase/3-demethylubiquinol 3-O-methyltransferase UbiG [Shewanella canadensis]|uniref:Ubiquinone biosynthesis O-methyltransferase n=1 Tax=Shewanella canadensis TaxID=271096 RepID=A0A431WN61_9GAMM|nr:bifunctional 2-polyprenyl-6-hydroxyphenol methylase/3-demethylubiquinol 3-O-methyltransferase UbiG [Shewanella canadensis]RTR36886.1 bifunctional 2-polyprenyl-6-hydroxyphenol methylase/3-demethylubiquinol 3-O-methyltransferase UbiG [Shewanella canadensis]
MLDKSRLSPSLNSEKKSALDTEREIAKFDALANEWRDPKGRFKHVLAFNQTRLIAIEDAIAYHFERDLNQDVPFSDLSLLDIGCGAGLLCEPLAWQGARVSGIDASSHNIALARQHANSNLVTVDYRHCLAESLLTAEDKQINDIDQYDVVLNTEVIEHVDDQEALIQTCCQLLKPGGLLIMATLNRTIKSYLIGIIGAEYLMRYLPIGTHDWRFFVTPKEIDDMITPHGLRTVKAEGMSFNPLTKKWKVTNSTDVNYLLYAIKS